MQEKSIKENRAGRRSVKQWIALGLVIIGIPAVLLLSWQMGDGADRCDGRDRCGFAGSVYYVPAVQTYCGDRHDLRYGSGSAGRFYDRKHQCFC